MSRNRSDSNFGRKPYGNEHPYGFFIPEPDLKNLTAYTAMVTQLLLFFRLAAELNFIADFFKYFFL